MSNLLTLPSIKSAVDITQGTNKSVTILSSERRKHDRNLPSRRFVQGGSRDDALLAESTFQKIVDKQQKKLNHLGVQCCEELGIAQSEILFPRQLP